MKNIKSVSILLVSLLLYAKNSLADDSYHFKCMGTNLSVEVTLSPGPNQSPMSGLNGYRGPMRFKGALNGQVDVVTGNDDLTWGEFNICTDDFVVNWYCLNVSMNLFDSNAPGTENSFTPTLKWGNQKQGTKSSIDVSCVKI